MVVCTLAPLSVSVFVPRAALRLSIGSALLVSSHFALLGVWSRSHLHGQSANHVPIACEWRE